MSRMKHRPLSQCLKQPVEGECAAKRHHVRIGHRKTRGTRVGAGGLAFQGREFGQSTRYTLLRRRDLGVDGTDMAPFLPSATEKVFHKFETENSSGESNF